MKSPFRKIAVGTLAAFTFVAAAPAESVAGPRYGWHGHHGYWTGPTVAAGIIGGLALGAVVASTYPYGSDPGGCVWHNRPAYDAWGRFVGYRRVCD